MFLMTQLLQHVVPARSPRRRAGRAAWGPTATKRRRRRRPKGKHRGGSAQYPSKPPAAAPAVVAASAHPRRLAAWQHLAPGGEGCATPCTTSCTTLYGGDLPGQPEPFGRSPGSRCARVEELLGDDQWASPVPRPFEYGADLPTDASKPPSLCPSSFSFSQADPKAYPKKEAKAREWQEPCDGSPSLADLMRSLKQYEEEYLPPEHSPHRQHQHQHHHHHHHHTTPLQVEERRGPGHPPRSS
ncbi:hypothetical protein JRQ81_007546 [Phrynocephalus forsythii]|uniref:Uncharacterized protein n=1 Tax=Phrynocephalus forsythii TaxID=171643 RepID=A0A9Q0Y529_9SAUR|nr:hypothetical protein JRQ81_007546 [Phrynocephalus forsythii]